MTQPIPLINQVYAVEVPEHLLQQEYRFEQSIPRMLKGSKGDDELVITGIMKRCGSGFDKATIDLTVGNWQLICTTKEVTNEKLALIFGHPFIGEVYARESLNALLTSKGLDPENKNYVLLKIYHNAT